LCVWGGGVFGVGGGGVFCAFFLLFSGSSSFWRPSTALPRVFPVVVFDDCRGDQRALLGRPVCRTRPLAPELVVNILKPLDQETCPRTASVKIPGDSRPVPPSSTSWPITIRDPARCRPAGRRCSWPAPIDPPESSRSPPVDPDGVLVQVGLPHRSVSRPRCRLRHGKKTPEKKKREKKKLKEKEKKKKS